MPTTTHTDTSTGESAWTRTYKTLELRCYSDESLGYLQITAKLSTLNELAKLLPMRNDFQEVISTASSSYMPLTKYDELGSTVLIYAGGYGQLTHAMPLHESSEAEHLYSRLQMIDVLLADGWEPMGAAAHGGEAEGSSVTVETWLKREKHLNKA